jgi:hypothetical protein
MTPFTLTSGAATFDFDPAGGVSSAGVAAGAWTTNATNQIVVTKNDGTTVTFAVDWFFNARNQLTIQKAGAEVFNFATAQGLRNSFTTDACVLLVKPAMFGPFVFRLRGAWDLNADHDLTFTVNTKISTLNGFVSDPLGRFIYHFANLDSPLQTSVLGFAGAWQSKTAADGSPLLEFHYKKEPKADGSSGGEGVFDLPAAVAISRNTNQLTYTYSKDNKTLSINFQGTLMIGPDFQLTYVVQRQVSSSGAELVGSTTLGFDATIAKPNLQGDLELTIVKPDGTGTAGTTTLTIGGSFAGVLGKTGLQVGFAYTQTFGPDNQISRTAAFSGDLEFPEGKVRWTFSAAGSTTNLAVGVDIKFGSVTGDARLDATIANGEVSGITFFLGLSF